MEAEAAIAAALESIILLLTLCRVVRHCGQGRDDVIIGIGIIIYSLFTVSPDPTLSTVKLLDMKEVQLYRTFR